MSTLPDPESIHPPFGQYAHGIEVEAESRMVMTSGQLGISKNGAIPSDVSAQTELCFDSIAAILEGAEMTLENVVQLRAYVTDRSYFADYMAVRDMRLGGRKVASTLMIVSGFTREEFLVEVEAVAARL